MTTILYTTDGDLEFDYRFKSKTGKSNMRRVIELFARHFGVNYREISGEEEAHYRAALHSQPYAATSGLPISGAPYLFFGVRDDDGPVLDINGIDYRLPQKEEWSTKEVADVWIVLDQLMRM